MSPLSAKIPSDDPFVKNVTCQSFVRSDGAPKIDCSPGPLEPLNQITHWLDSSNVYGSEDYEADHLR